MIVTYIHSTHLEDQFRVQLRCRNFADAINRFGCHGANLLDLNSFIQKTPESQHLCDGSDLLVIHRYLYGPVLQAIEYWKAYDKKVVVDFDQAIDHLTPEMPGHSFWLKRKPLEQNSLEDIYYGKPMDSTPLEQFKWGLGLIDAAIVSSTRLVIDWSPFTEVYEVPDYLNTDQYPASKQLHENEIWIGLANNIRMASIKNTGLLSALENVCRNRPQVKLILNDCQYDADRMSNISSSQIVVYPSNLFEQWADILLKLDIGLVPLHGEYDLRHGRINLLEFMISKTPWIASNQPCFRELARYGKLVQNSASDWESAITKAVDHINIMQKRASGEPFLFALSQDINENIDKVLKLYAHILAQPQRSGART
jgi:glycosyltransferase involved in cell wall biosynthesis